MAIAKFYIPNEAQQQLMRECGVDPQGYVVRNDSENILVLLHLKTRNEIMIVKIRRGKLW